MKIRSNAAGGQMDTASHVSALEMLFVEVCGVKGLSLQEHEVATFIRKALADSCVSIFEDESGKRHGGTVGNLIVVPDEFDASEPAIGLFSHMDTVRDTSLCRPVVEHDRIASDGKNQLGVDNRVGISLLLYLLKSRKTLGLTANFIVVFTIAEEIGMYGAYGLDLSRWRLTHNLIFDSAKRPGAYVFACAGMHQFEARFTGKSAHSAVEPEKGVSAILAAAKALNSVTFGRLAPGVTANVGRISGGEATNVIPESCLIEGEVRALDEPTILQYLATYEKAFQVAAESSGASLQFSSKKDFAPYTLAHAPELIAKVEAALRAAGREPQPLTYTGGSDANVLNEKGIPSINLGIGAQNPHSDHEFILKEDFEAIFKTAFYLLTHA